MNSSTEDPKTVANAGHRVTKLFQLVKRVSAENGLDTTFGSGTLALGDVEVIVKEFEEFDPASTSFRYPTKKDPTPALPREFTFSVRRFAATMDEVLRALSGA